MNQSELFDVFVCYDESTGKNYAETVHDALKRRGCTVFVAHMERSNVDGDFEEKIDNIIKNCKVFILIISYDALTRSQIQREVKTGQQNEKFSDPHNFWIFHDRSSDSRGSPEFTRQTGIRLEVMAQNDFSDTGMLATYALKKYDVRRSSKIQGHFITHSDEKDEIEEKYIKSFADQYTNQGYETHLEYKNWKNSYVDLVLRKDNEMILCEFKKSAHQVNTNVFRQLLKHKSEIENIDPKTKVRLWLIVTDSFNFKLVDEAKNYDIELFDENNLNINCISISADRTVYTINSIVHLRIKPQTQIESAPIEIQVFNSKNIRIFQDEIQLQKEKEFQEYDIVIQNDLWQTGQEYVIKAKHGLCEGTDSFSIQERHSIIELDQKVYTWTDNVFITIISPDSDRDNQKIKTIGNRDDSEVTIRTSRGILSNYPLKEAGESTGIFQGVIRLTGFKNDVLKFDHISNFGITSDVGSSNGLLACSNYDILEVTFKHAHETVVCRALVVWNIGEIQWMKPSFSINEQAVVRVIDPDMNLDPYLLDEFTIHVWSDSDKKGINLKVKETTESSGIFYGKVNLKNSESSDNSLHVTEGDTITAEYVDKTLPDPYAMGDELIMSSTSIIDGLPPLKRIELKNPRILDENENKLTVVSKEQQIQITCDLNNLTNYEQEFAYIVSIRDPNDVKSKSSWLIGTITKGQSFTPSLSWIPKQSGKHIITIYVWRDIDDPTLLSHPIDLEIFVL